MKTYKTRGGRTIHMLATDLPGDRPFCGYYVENGQAMSLRWRKSGHIHEPSTTGLPQYQSGDDLMLEDQHVTLWLNIYHDRVYPQPLNAPQKKVWRITAHESRAKADEHCDVQGRVACVPLRFDRNQGQTVGNVLTGMFDEAGSSIDPLGRIKSQSVHVHERGYESRDKGPMYVF